MKLIFYYGSLDKMVVKDRFISSSVANSGRITPQNRKFLQAIGLTVIQK